MGNAGRLERRSDDGLPDVLPAVLAASPDPEEQIVALWLKGERRIGPLARALRVDHLPVDEQRRALKRLKDRLRNRVKRVLRKVKRR
jgi:hypothetical protein